MSNLEVVYSNPECDIFYNKTLHIIQTFWKGLYTSEATFRRILDQLIEALEMKSTSIIIADATNMHVISKNDQDWILNDWYPRAVHAGFRFQGLIMNKDTFNALTVKKISEEYDKAVVTTQYFESNTQALDWVKEIQKENSMI